MLVFYWYIFNATKLKRKALGGKVGMVHILFYTDPLLVILTPL
ncbi:hypothetical protein CLV98_1201 [Dyadobacter jejuensis]|uniref:Uncharacterized protein n=1 Tax=Dyadobacter jejuensis TaxID=1082580 RepID=A0A316A845_9BACT|nr:hypothetical protein CLV98_1201 [Dyadobacter jejuensis]